MKKIFLLFALFASIVCQATITFGAAGPAKNATGTLGTAQEVLMPTGVLAGHLLTIVVSHKDTTLNFTIPSGWAIAGEYSGGLGPELIDDQGICYVTVFYKVADGTEVSAFIQPRNTYTARAFRFTKSDALKNWEVVSCGGADNTVGTDFGVTATTDAGFTVGDYLFLGVAINGNINGTSFTTPAPTLTIPGVTTGTVTSRNANHNGTGYDITGFAYTASISTGTSTGAPSFEMTMTGSTTVYYPTGAMAFIRFREVDPPTGLPNRKMVI